MQNLRSYPTIAVLNPPPISINIFHVLFKERKCTPRKSCQKNSPRESSAINEPVIGPPPVICSPPFG